MLEQKKRNLLVIFSVIYFIIFLLLPTLFLGSGFFAEDIGWYFEYMVKIYPFLSVVFLIITLNYFGFTKKRFFWLSGLMIISCVVSAIYICKNWNNVF